MFNVHTYEFKCVTGGRNAVYRMVTIAHTMKDRAILIRRWGKIGGSLQSKIERGTIRQVEALVRKEQRKRSTHEYSPTLSDVETYADADSVKGELYEDLRTASTLDMGWVSMSGGMAVRFEPSDVVEKPEKSNEPEIPLVRPDSWGTW